MEYRSRKGLYTAVEPREAKWFSSVCGTGEAADTQKSVPTHTEESRNGTEEKRSDAEEGAYFDGG